MHHDILEVLPEASSYVQYKNSFIFIFFTYEMKSLFDELLSFMN